MSGRSIGERGEDIEEKARVRGTKREGGKEKNKGEESV